MCASVKLLAQAQGLWRDSAAQITYTDTLSLDMSTVQPSLAGPKRPQDTILLTDMKGQFHLDLINTYGAVIPSYVDCEINGVSETIGDGSVVIAAITSCTIPQIHRGGSGLVARKARASAV